jgi:outer membrane protein assembly factor BamB
MPDMRPIGLILLAAMLAGCGTVADPTEWFSEPTTEVASPLVELEEQIQPQRLWSRDIGAGTDEQLLNLQPRIIGDTVFVADAEGRVQALDATDGRTRWEVDLDLPVSGGPGGGDGLVLVGTSDGEVLALGATDGETRWRTRVSSEVLSVPAIENGVVVVHTVDGKLFGLEATNGNERWRYEREVPVLTLRGTGSPVISGGAVFAGMAGGKLLALRIDNGNLVWDVNVTVPGGRSELQRLADIDGDPLVFGGGVFVATYQGEVAAIEQRSGRLAWRRKMSSYRRMAVDSQGLFVADDEGLVWALNVRSGDAVWSQDALKYRKLSSVGVLRDYVVVGDFEGYLHWIDRANGELVGRSRVGSKPITNGLQVVDDVLYVQGDGGELAAMRLPAAR